MSLHDDDNGTQADFVERMKHTRAFKLHGFKGNSRGTSISAPFTTLEAAFKACPPGTGFNIELSMYYIFLGSEGCYTNDVI